MANPKIHYLVDILMGIAFIITVITILPLARARGAHTAFGWAFVVLVIIHFLLHWNWLVCITKSLFKNSNTKTKKTKT